MFFVGHVVVQVFVDYLVYCFNDVIGKGFVAVFVVGFDALPESFAGHGDYFIFARVEVGVAEVFLFGDFFYEGAVLVEEKSECIVISFFDLIDIVVYNLQLHHRPFECVFGDLLGI